MTEAHLDAWLDAARTPESDVPQVRAWFSDPDWLRGRFVAMTDGSLSARARLRPVGPGLLALDAPIRTDGGPLTEPDVALVPEAIREAWDQGALAVECRIPLPRLTEPLAAAADRSGGVRRADRIEYRTPLDQLPGEDPDPSLTWRSGDPPEALAPLFVACHASTPDGLDPSEDPLDLVQGYVAAGRVDVGVRDGRDVAIVCARAHPDGWSTLTFMGLVPDARGLGLGTQTQRHGLAMARSLGGTTYHGGTSATNAPMRACFARLGCAEHLRFGVWVWHRP